MTDLVSIARAVDYVEDCLRLPITVADMAGSASYSVYHFCRMFNQVTHHPPYDYLMRRRLSESASALLRSDRKIIDIALEYQFKNPETFSRAFKRMFGTQPSRLRKRGYIDRRRLMPKLTLVHLRHIETGMRLPPCLVENEAFQVAGFQTIVGDDQRAVSELWALLDQELRSVSNDRRGASYVGLRYYPERWEEVGTLYVAGIESRDSGILGAGAVVKTVPARECVRFVHAGSTDELGLTLDYVYHTWSPRSGTRLAHRWVIERYGPDARGSRDRSETRILIPIEARASGSSTARRGPPVASGSAPSHA
jgi:AraC family transcriptional regulator